MPSPYVRQGWTGRAGKVLTMSSALTNVAIISEIKTSQKRMPRPAGCSSGGGFGSLRVPEPTVGVRVTTGEGVADMIADWRGGRVQSGVYR